MRLQTRRRSSRAQTPLSRKRWCIFPSSSVRLLVRDDYSTGFLAHSRDVRLDDSSPHASPPSSGPSRRRKAAPSNRRPTGPVPRPQGFASLLFQSRRSLPTWLDTALEIAFASFEVIARGAVEATTKRTQ